MDDKQKAEQTNKLPAGVSLRLEWGTIDDLPTLYANQMFITHAGQEFYLVFGEVAPVLFNKDNPPDHLEIKPVAKLAIAPDNMELFLQVIKDNFERYKAEHNAEKE